MTHTRQLAILSLCFLATIASIQLAGCPKELLDSGICSELPATIGDWQGMDVYYCQNSECLSFFTGDRLEQHTICPNCGAPLERSSPSEKKQLPQDTRILKKNYTRSTGEQIFVTVVVTGRQRSSIHRPQWCLPGQGYSIEATTRLEKPFPATQLTLRKDGGLESAKSSGHKLVFVYWFIGGKRHAANNGDRLFWMAWDNLFGGIIQQWAYVAVSTKIGVNKEDASSLLENFISKLQPEIIRNSRQQ